MADNRNFMNIPRESSTNQVSTPAVDEDLAPNTPAAQSRQPAMPAPPISVQTIPFTPTDNIMGNYDQSTYHISWVLTDDASSRQAEVVIAETGSTELNIREMTVSSAMGPNGVTKNVTATKITMKVYENMGSNLPDRMMAAAKKLQTKNYVRAPWKIRLRLHGMDPVTGKSVPNIAGMTWEWPVVMINIQTRIDESGSLHTVEMVPQYETAQFDQYFRLSSSFKVDADTVGGVLEGLIDAMNKHVIDSYGYPFTVYKIIDRPYRSAFNNMISSPFSHKIGDSGNISDSRRYPRGAQISNGTSMTEILDGIMAASPTAVQMATTTRDHDQRGLTESVDLVSTFHRLLAKVEMGAYNDIVNDYEKTITFIVQPYESLRMISNVSDVNVEHSTQMYRDRARLAMSRNYLKKEYNYIFTGKNTEVLKFDIDVNFRWAVAAESLQGTVHYGSQTQGRGYDPRRAQANLVQVRDALNSNTQARADATRLESANDQRPESRVTNESEDRANERITSTAQLLDEERRVRQENIEALRGRQAVDLDNAALRRSEFSRYTSSNRRVFSDDLITTSSDFDPLPMTLVLDGGSSGSSYYAISEENVTRQRSVYGLLLNQLYGELNDGNLVDIKMDIRGDPYWLGTSDFTSTQYGDKTVEVNRLNALSSPAYVDGEYMFLLRFNMPQGHRADGSPVLNQDNMYSGFYRCVEVTNNFVNGQFTQSLRGIRVPGWTIKTVLGG